MLKCVCQNLGLILQELLLFPTNATPLPFGVHHVLLTATLCTPLENPPPLGSITRVPGQPRTKDQRKELVRPVVDACLTPKWIAGAENKARYEALMEHVVTEK